MSVFDKMDNYMRSEKEGVADSKYDLSSPTGYFLNAIKNNGFNLDELESALVQNGTQLVISGAGSGKTQFLSFKLQYDINSGQLTKIINPPNGQPLRVLDNVLITTFSNTGADEIKDRTISWQRKLRYNITATNMTFCTLHAEFKRCLNAMGVKTNLLTAKESRGMLREVLKKYCIGREDGYPLTNDDYSQIESIIAFTRNRLDELRYSHPKCNDYGLTPTILDAVIESYKQRRRVLEKVDFEDLQEILYGALRVNPAVQEFVANRYKFIYLDEFQDTSQIQYEVLKYYFRGCKKVVAIGDDDQSIYSWRGGDINIITNRFQKDYNPTVNTLSVNYRCPSNILEPIIGSITKNVNRYDKPLKSSREGGTLLTYSLKDMKAMLNTLMFELRKDLSTTGQSAILCRTNFDGMIPAFLLQMQNVCDFGVTSYSMTLDSALPRKILGIANLITDKYSPAVKTTLEMLVDRRNKWQVREFITTCKSTNVSIFTVPMKDLVRSFPELEDLVGTLKDYKNNRDDIGALKYLLSHVRFNVYSGDSAFCRSACAYIDLLMFFIESNNFETIPDMLEEISSINDKLNARVGKKKVPIVISTVHEAKGREWENVYIWNNSEGVFPSPKTDVENAEQMEEERRVHYIAWTRAKEKLVTLSLENQESMFLKETGLKGINPIKPGGTFKNGVQEDKSFIDSIPKSCVSEK